MNIRITMMAQTVVTVTMKQHQISVQFPSVRPFYHNKVITILTMATDMAIAMAVIRQFNYLHKFLHINELNMKKKDSNYNYEIDLQCTRSRQKRNKVKLKKIQQFSKDQKRECFEIARLSLNRDELNEYGNVNVNQEMMNWNWRNFDKKYNDSSLTTCILKRESLKLAFHFENISFHSVVVNGNAFENLKDFMNFMHGEYFTLFLLKCLIEASIAKVGMNYKGVKESYNALMSMPLPHVKIKRLRRAAFIKGKL